MTVHLSAKKQSVIWIVKMGTKKRFSSPRGESPRLSVGEGLVRINWLAPFLSTGELWTDKKNRSKVFGFMGVVFGIPFCLSLYRNIPIRTSH